MKTLAVPLILALGGAVAAAPGIRPVPGGRTDRQMTAMAVSGQTHLVSREIQVDLEFQGGALGKGRLSILL